MEERRLDTRVSKSKPYEMAQPALKLLAVARWYRLILSTLQAIMLLLPLCAIGLNPDLFRWPPVLLSGLYLLMYLARYSDVFGGQSYPQWRWRQIITGYTEIVLVGLIGWIYSSMGLVGISEYWWALYILPIYRLAETSGFWPWLSGMLASSVLILLSLHSSGTEPEGYDLLVSAGKVTALLLATTTPFYLVRSLDLARRASQYFAPLTSRFIATSTDDAWGERLLEAIIEEGIHDLIGANCGAFWCFDTQISERAGLLPELKLVHTSNCAFRPINSDDIPDLDTSIANEHVVLADGILRDLDKSKDDIFVDNRHLPPSTADTPWLMPTVTDVKSWMVVPVGGKQSKRLIGFIEIGFHRKLWGLERPGIEERTLAVADSISEVYERIGQNEANQLRATLINLEYQTLDKTRLYQKAIKAIGNYFRRPVLIIQISLISKRIETIIGDIGSEEVNRLETWLAQENLERLLSSDDVIYNSGSQLSGEQGAQISFIISPLLLQDKRAELLVLMDTSNLLGQAEHQTLRELAATVNAAAARMRAAQVIQAGDYGEFGPQATRKQLIQLTRNVKEHMAADVVVLYEYEDGHPKHAPIIVGELKKPDYLQEKPIVIEKANPISRVEFDGIPYFSNDIQSDPVANPLNTGLNRHGDPVFVIRESIASSVGLPLKRTGGH